MVTPSKAASDDLTLFTLPTTRALFLFLSQLKSLILPTRWNICKLDSGSSCCAQPKQVFLLCKTDNIVEEGMSQSDSPELVWNFALLNTLFSLNWDCDQSCWVKSPNQLAGSHSLGRKEQWFCTSLGRFEAPLSMQPNPPPPSHSSWAVKTNWLYCAWSF